MYVYIWGGSRVLGGIQLSMFLRDELEKYMKLGEAIVCRKEGYITQIVGMTTELNS